MKIAEDVRADPAHRGAFAGTDRTERRRASSSRGWAAGPAKTPLGAESRFEDRAGRAECRALDLQQQNGPKKRL